MKRYNLVIMIRLLPRALRILSGLAMLAVAAQGAETASTALTPAAVEAAIRRSADWQLSIPLEAPARDWVVAPWYDSLVRLSQVTGDARYLAEVIKIGDREQWRLADRKYHADDHAVGHAWLDIYLMDETRKERLQPTRAGLDAVLAAPVTEKMDFRRKPQTPGLKVTDRWSWCDALYMAPPTLVRLYLATGDARYLDFMDQEYRETWRSLYDHEESLFYRDANFLEKKGPHGTKIFWSRGNGWVYAGLGLLLEKLPKNDPRYHWYLGLYHEMTTAVVKSQQADGLWRANLVDPLQVPAGETSGTAFFLFGLAWGINHGLLDREVHWPAVERGWVALQRHVKPDGFVGYVQKIGFQPDSFDANSKREYGTGAYVLAGCEILRALGGARPPADAQAFLHRAETLAHAKPPAS
jgi:unsaturated rhamnogalacturonyl hydrolase